jgi:hypothetical protein
MMNLAERWLEISKKFTEQHDDLHREIMRRGFYAGVNEMMMIYREIANSSLTQEESEKIIGACMLDCLVVSIELQDKYEQYLNQQP